MGQEGDFPATGLEREEPPHPLSKQRDDIDLEKFFKAIETLERRARTMDNVQLYRLNQRLGEAVNQFKKAVTAYICRERPNEPGRLYAGELVKMADTGARARIVRFVDPTHMIIEKDDGGRQTVTRDELRKIHSMSADIRDSGLDPVGKVGAVLRKTKMEDAGV